MLKLPINRDVVTDMMKQKPRVALAFGRTILANERTFLAFLRTSFGLLAGGIGIVGFVDRPIIFALGWLSIALSVPFFIWGIWRYKVTKELIVGSALTVFHEDEDPGKA